MCQIATASICSIKSLTIFLSSLFNNLSLFAILPFNYIITMTLPFHSLFFMLNLSTCLLYYLQCDRQTCIQTDMLNLMFDVIQAHL